MTATMNFGVIIACAIGGSVVLVIVATIGILLFLRSRHRRKVLAMDRASSPGRDEIPARNVSMTDADIESQPLTRAMLRKSTRGPQSCSQLYVAMSSKESIPQYQGLRKSSDPPLAKPSIPEVDQHQQSWPLPRRLTKSSTTVIPLARLQGARVAGTPKHDATLPRSNTAPRKAIQKNLPSGYPLSEKSTNADLKPKTLAVTRKRSMSEGMLPMSSKDMEKRSTIFVLDSKSGRQIDHTSRRQRSNSLYTRQPETAPSEPVPPLPGKSLINGPDSPSKSPGKRASIRTARSRDTAVLHDGIAKCLSQIETDLQSISAASPIGSRSNGRQGVHGQTPEPGRPGKPSGLINVSDQATPRSDIQTKTQRHSPQSPSRSSGLSISLLDLSPMRSKCRLTLNLDDSPLSKLKFLRDFDKVASTLPASNSPMALNRSSMFKIHDENTSKRASMTMQDVFSQKTSKKSDLQGTDILPTHGNTNSRPLSIATSDPFQYEHRDGDPSSKCESCLRNSGGSIASFSWREAQKTSGDIHVPSSKVLRHISKPTDLMHPLPQPPVARDQLPSTPTPESRGSHMSIHPSSSFLNMHNPFPASSPRSPLATPTLQGFASPTSITHPNRDKPIFDYTPPQTFTFPTTEQKSSLPAFHLNPSEHDQTSEDLPNPTSDDLLKPERPFSTLFPFPTPPHEAKPNGPRSQPPSSSRQAPNSSKNRSLSPSKNRINKIATSSTWGPANSPRQRDLKKMVSDLRRESSDASKIVKLERSDSYRKGHERYCSLGGDDDEGDGKGNFVVDDLNKENEDFYGTETTRKGVVKVERDGDGVGMKKDQVMRTPVESAVKGPREMPGGNVGVGGKSRIPRIAGGGGAKVKTESVETERGEYF